MTEIVNDFNKFFVNIGPSLGNNIDNNNSSADYMHNIQRNDSSIFLSPITEDEIIKITYTNFKPNKAAGYDDVKPDIMKLAISFIAKPLTHIFNMSFANGTFPDKLKTAKIIPVFKKGDPSSYTNYRPISLLSCFSKILERLMFNRIYSFISMHDILSHNQYGFRPGHSTELALIDVIDKLCTKLDNKKISVGIFLDLSKAFDTIDHYILLNKLSHYGIRGTALSWMQTYLTNRHQYTSMNGTNSDLLTLKCGVPQGSILGPLLFIIYVNDISQISYNANVTLFADDTSIFFDDDNIDMLYNTICNELPKFTDWFAVNKLSLNIDKTNYIVFNRGTKYKWDRNIHIDGKIVDHVYKTKFLGVVIDSKLTWHDHISTICKIIARNTGILSRLKYSVPQHILKTIYQTLVLPHMSYCTIVWSGTSRIHLHPLEILQKRAIRHITKSPTMEHTSTLFKSLKLLKFNDIVKIKLLTFAHNAQNGILPSNFDLFFILNNQIHSHDTRQFNNLHLPKSRTNTGLFSVRSRSVNQWNSLHVNIQSMSLILFKKEITNIMISLY